MVMVKDVMTPKVVVFLEDDPVSLVLRAFNRSKISGAPIVNAKGQYVGIITKTDLSSEKFVEIISGFPSIDLIPIREVMNKTSLITVQESDPIRNACEAMLSNHIHRVFVTNKKGAIVGVVSSFDMMRVCNSTPACKTAGGMSSWWFLNKDAKIPCDKC